MAVKFFKCSHCGKVIVKVCDSSVSTVCCGEEMKELSAKDTGTGAEKHVPVVTPIGKCRIKVEIGQAAHPMTEPHRIMFIALETMDGFQLKWLKVTDKPEAVFYIGEEMVLAVYEYCNLHGLWKTSCIEKCCRA